MSFRQLPAHWVGATIGEVVDPVESIDPGADPGAWIDYIDIGSIDNQAGLVTTPKRLLGADGPSRARQAVRLDDVLFSTVRPYLRAIAAVPRLQRPVASTGFCVLRAAAGVDPRFLLHWVRSTEFVDCVLPFQRGSSYPAVRDADVYSQPMPLPPEAEQRRIAACLDELLTGLDEANAELVEAQRKLALYRQSLLKSAVEGALTAEWRRQNARQETGAELLAHILGERSVAAADRREHESSLSLPASWAHARIGQLATVGTGVTPLRTQSTYFEGGTVPWVTSGALNRDPVASAEHFVTAHALDECRLRIYPAGTLLVAMYGEGKTRGKCAELAIDATINQAIAALVFDGSAALCKPFVKLLLWSSYDRMREEASGGVQPNLNLSIVRSIAVPLPPLAEQQEIVTLVEEQLEAVNEQAAVIDRLISMATAQRQNILRAAFSGQLIPQDPNDEPASVLLERIRAVRQRLSSQPAQARRTRRAAC